MKQPDVNRLTNDVYFDDARERRHGVKGRDGINVGSGERVASSVAGAILTYEGLKHRTPFGLAIAIAGGTLLWRGLSGKCQVYRTLGKDTAHPTRADVRRKLHSGISVRRTITIMRPVEEVYKYWRNFENFPNFMKYLDEVRTVGHKTSHWTAKGPAGYRVEWDAEIINERENELIAWESIPGSDVDNAGTVRFKSIDDGVGTEISLTLRYYPPAGRAGNVIARIFGRDPEHEIDSDLERFRLLLGARQLASTDKVPRD